MDFVGRRGPARRQTDDGVSWVVCFPEAISDFFCELFKLVMGQDDEDLVGRSVESQAIAVRLQGVANRIGFADGVRAIARQGRAVRRQMANLHKNHESLSYDIRYDKREVISKYNKNRTMAHREGLL